MSTLNLYTPHKLPFSEVKEFIIDQIQKISSKLEYELNSYEDDLIEYTLSDDNSLDARYAIEAITENIEYAKEKLDHIDSILGEIYQNEIKLTQKFSPEEIPASNQSESEIKKMLHQGYLYEINLFDEPLFIKYRYQITIESKHDLSIIKSYL